MNCENCANAYDEGYTAGHNAENARLREQAAILQDGRCTSCMEPINPLNMKCRCVRNEFETLYFQLTECENEVSSIREQAEALADALEELQATVQATCEGWQVDIPGLEILGEALDEADAALRAFREGRDE